MSEQPRDRLHLPDLAIDNFRGIDHLSIKRLGRVTLLGGRNGVGKTTVLEAVRLHAARGHPTLLDELLGRREELANGLDEDNDPVVFPDYAALFHGRAAARERPIRIGPNAGTDDLRIEVSSPEDWPPEERERIADRSTDMKAVKVVYRDKDMSLLWLPSEADLRSPWSRRRYSSRVLRHERLGDEASVIECEALGPGLPDNRQLARFWNRVALTDEEDFSLQALRLAGDGIERVAVVSDEGTGYREGRRVVVKLREHSRPVPLKSLGDGIARLFAAGLALAHSRNGFLVIDEAENGIHYTIQRQFWRMVLLIAHQYNVQVLATTHSSDCVTGFARAATEIDQVDGVYLRLDREGNHVRAVEYDEEELEVVATQGIEVR